MLLSLGIDITLHPAIAKSFSNLTSCFSLESYRGSAKITESFSLRVMNLSYPFKILLMDANGFALSSLINKIEFESSILLKSPSKPSATVKYLFSKAKLITFCNFFPITTIFL